MEVRKYPDKGIKVKALSEKVNKEAKILRSKAIRQQDNNGIRL